MHARGQRLASDFLEKNEQPTLYRVHEGPTPEKLEALRTMLKDFGAHAGGGDKPQAATTRAPEAHQGQALRRHAADGDAALAPAGGVHAGERGPLRPRLRRLRALHLAHPPLPGSPGPSRHQGGAGGKRYDAGDLDAIGQHCSETERRADDATRDVEAWLKTYYMQDHVGDEYDGTISGVTHFGLFVTLDELYVDGLVHISDLGQDYFQFDAAKHCCAASARA
jgi:ribonuclease R